jgi:hypothetical protein
LVTPLRIELIPTGQRQALRGVFGGVLLLVCLTNLGSLLIQLMWPHHLDPADLLLLWEVCAGGIVALALDFYTLTWVGMWMGLRAKRHNRAIFGTLARILLVPWLIMFFAWFALATNSRFGSGDAVVLFALWFIFVAVLDLALAVRARSRVFEALRNLGEPTGAAAEIPMAGCALIRTARSGTVLSAQS